MQRRCCWTRIFLQKNEKNLHTRILCTQHLFMHIYLCYTFWKLRKRRSLLFNSLWWSYFSLFKITSKNISHNFSKRTFFDCAIIFLLATYLVQLPPMPPMPPPSSLSPSLMSLPLLLLHHPFIPIHFINEYKCCELRWLADWLVHIQ